MSTKTGAAAAGRPREASPAPRAAAFDLDRAWQLDDRVAVRPEPFGALLYHFGTRRLSFLKNTTVLEIVRSLGEHASARSACVAAGVGDAGLLAYERALATLAESQMIREREAVGPEREAPGPEREAVGPEREAPGPEREAVGAGPGLAATSGVAS